jgi:fatty-acid desaturase
MIPENEIKKMAKKINNRYKIRMAYSYALWILLVATVVSAVLDSYAGARVVGVGDILWILALGVCLGGLAFMVGFWLWDVRLDELGGLWKKISFENNWKLCEEIDGEKYPFPDSDFLQMK